MTVGAAGPSKQKQRNLLLVPPQTGNRQASRNKNLGKRGKCILEPSREICGVKIREHTIVLIKMFTRLVVLVVIYLFMRFFQIGDWGNEASESTIIALQPPVRSVQHTRDG